MLGHALPKSKIIRACPIFKSQDNAKLQKLKYSNHKIPPFTSQNDFVYYIKLNMASNKIFGLDVSKTFVDSM